jgi:hypothetical protein
MSEHKTVHFPRRAVDSDGNSYALEFYGENEMAAVVAGPTPTAGQGVKQVPELHREPASSSDDAWAKLDAWVKARGWSIR